MEKITFKGSPVHLLGDAPTLGTKAQDFSLVGTSLQEVSLSDFKNKKIVLNIFPSVDTSVCAQSARKFNRHASGLENTVVLCISKDLPFAQKRFCAAEGLDHVHMLSGYRSPDFGLNYGVALSSSPLAHLYTRAVMVLNDRHEFVSVELVSEITHEPDYDKALRSL